MQAWRLGLLVACGLLLLWRPGILMDDEVVQAASLTSLLEGHLAIHADLPAGYRPILDSPLGGWVVPQPGEPPAAPIASTMLSVLAAPVLLVLRGLAAVLGTQGALALACALPWAAAAWWERRRPMLGRIGPWMAGVPVLMLATPILWPQDTAAGGSPWLEFAALQLVSLVAHAATAALLWRLLAGRVSPEVRLGLTLAYAFATPMAFWALSAKYHALATLLLVLAVWLYRDGHRTPAPRTFAAFLVAGLACWNELVLGLFLATALGAVGLRGLRHAPAHWLPRAGAALAGFAAGFLAFVAQQRLLRAEGVAPQFPVFSPPPAPTGGYAVQSFAALEEQGYLSHTLLADPLGGLSAIAQTFVWTRLEDVDPAFSFLSVAPFAILALAALLHRPWRRASSGDLRLLAGIYAAVLLFFMGRFLLEPGAGYDIRYASTLWPLLVLLAAPAADAVSAGAPLRAAGRAVAGGVAALLPLAILPTWALHQAVLGYWSDYNYASEHVVLFRYGGLVLALAAGASLLWARRWTHHLVVAGVAMAFALQLLLQLSTARIHEPATALPGVFAPFEALHRLVWKLLFTFGDFTLHPDA